MGMSEPRIELRGFEMRDVRLSIGKSMRGCGETEVAFEARVLGRDNGQPDRVHFRELILGDYWSRMDSKERARVVFHALLRALEHELAECFYVDGVRVYDPHKDEVSDAK
jgi:hypothetical protein